MGRLRRVRPRDRGAAAVEFALVLPVFLMIIFAIIDFGRMLNAQITVNEAAREGARAMALYDQFEGEQRVRDVGAQIGTVDPVVLDDCGPNPSPDDDAVMRAEYDFHFVTPLGVIVNAIDNHETLWSEGRMPCIP